MRKPLRKAIFPVGGLGTRFLPATKAMPKEMLPVVDKPLIQYAVEEARAAGIEEMIFVTGRGKSAIEDHFDYSYELQDTLKSRSKDAELALIEDLLPMPGEAQPDHADQLFHSLPPHFGGEVEEPAVKVERLLGIQKAIQVRLFGQIADAGILGHVGGWQVEDGHLPLGGEEQAEHELDGRGLARSVGA